MLNKNICKACLLKSAKITQDMLKSVKTTQEEMNKYKDSSYGTGNSYFDDLLAFDELWNNQKMCLCLYVKLLDINTENIPKKCQYRLEHVMNSEKALGDKPVDKIVELEQLWDFE
jgi:hypothetical protein